MAKLLDLLDIVPSWCWAIVVAVLVALCLYLDSGKAYAQADAATARTQLLQVQLASARAIGAEQDRAAARVRDLTKTLLETQDALADVRQDGPGRVAALDERMRHFARPLPCSGASAAGGAAAPASRGDGQPVAGLLSLAGADFVLLDGQARRELAELVVSADQTVGAVKACRSLLRECWRSP